MANIELTAGDVENGYAEVVSILTRELARTAVAKNAMSRHIEEQEAASAETPEEEPSAE